MSQDRRALPTWRRRGALTLRLAGLVGFSLLATGCSLIPGKKTPTSGTKVQVRVWRMDQGVDSVRETIDSFQKGLANSAITYLNHKPENYELDALKSLAARQGPDIWSVPNDWLGDHTDRLQTLPDTYFTVDKKTTKPRDAVYSLFPSGIADQLVVSESEKVVGLPTNVETLQLYYNPSLLTAAAQEYRKSLGSNANETTYRPVQQLLSKAPTTWSELVEQEKYLTKIENGAITRSAISFGTADNVPAAGDIVQLLMLQNGAQIVSTDRKAVLFYDSQETPSGTRVRPGVKAIEFFAAFADPSKETYTWNAAMPPAIDAFAKGRVTMVIAYPDFGRQLKAKYPKFTYTTTVVPQVSVAQTPVNLIRFSVESVTKVADSSAAAFSLLKQYTADQVAYAMAREQKAITPYKKRLETSDDPIAKQVLTGQAIYKKNHTGFDAAFRQMIIDANANGIDPDEAVRTASETIAEYYLSPTPDPRAYTKK